MDTSIKHLSPSTAVYGELDKAYDLLNEKLFEGTLPRCLITLQRKRRVYGFFCGKAFGEIAEVKEADEIALNPDYLSLRDLRASLSTLAHEMVHLWQEHFGKPTPTNHHNAEWGRKMKSIGLTPKGPNGKTTGNKVSHEIEEDGLFASIAGEVLEACDLSTLAELLPRQSAPTKSRSGAYAKYVCPMTGTIARAKPGLSLKCGDYLMVEQI